MRLVLCVALQTLLCKDTAKAPSCHCLFLIHLLDLFVQLLVLDPINWIWLSVGVLTFISFASGCTPYNTVVYRPYSLTCQT